MMFSKEPDLLYRDKMYSCEDYDFILSNIKKGRLIKVLDEPLLKYRILNSSISRNGNKFIKRIFLEYAKYLYKLDIENEKLAYEKFDDCEFLELEMDESNTKIENLKFALDVAIKYKYKDEIKFIANKLKTNYQYKCYVDKLIEFPMLINLISIFKRKFS